MKLSELHPCDHCHGALDQHFYVVKVTHAFINARATNEVLGLNQFFQGGLKLAETFAPNDNPVAVAGEFDKSLWDELLLCRDCVLKNEISLAMAMEKEG